MSPTRRQVLKIAAGSLAVGGITALAGCSSSCPDSDPPVPDQIVEVDDLPTGQLDGLPSGDWPQAHGNPGNTGYSPVALPQEGLAVRWRTDLSLPVSDEGGLSASAPTVGAAQVAVADTQGVHSLALGTGELRWRSDTLSPTFFDSIEETAGKTVAPTIGPDGTIYVGTETGITALDGSDGTERWTVEGLSAVASPAFADGTIYALGAETLVALDHSGEERWRRPVERGDEPVPPGVGDGRVLCRTDDGLTAIATTGGEPRWQTTDRYETWPVVDGDTCFVGNYDGLHAFAVTSGDSLWTFSRGDYRAFLTHTITPDTIYAVEQPGEAGAASFALDRTDGEPEPRWCSAFGSGAVTAATDDFALATLSLGQGPEAGRSIVAFSREFGEAHWAIRGGSSPYDWVNPPALLERTVIVTTRGGRTIAVSGGGG